jgi:aminopeptidase
MADPRIEKLAKLTVNYSVSVKKGDMVQINAPIQCEPLALEMYREVLKAGGHPIMNPIFERTSEIFFEYAKDHQLDHTSPYRKFLIKNIDCSISIMADENTRSLANADPKKMARTQAASREIMEIYMDRSAKGDLRWCGLPYPTQALAQEGSMSLSEYEKFVYSACLVDRKDPIAEWKKVSKSQEKIAKYLDKVSRLEFCGEDTELKMSVKGRKWINCDGKFNMPDGEVFTGPVEDSVDGEIRFTFPGIVHGKEIEDIKLTFKRGKVVKASAAKGNEFLQHMLNIDEGSRRLGEVAIGTNYGITKFTKNILFDEKLGGTIHMAIGAAYPECNAKNKSAIHWDMIKDMKKGGEIYGDGILIYKNGKWLM